MMVPGWTCHKCAQSNPLTRNRCKKCGRKQVGDERRCLANKGNGKRTKLQRFMAEKGKMKKA